MTSSPDLDAVVKMLALIAGQTPAPELFNLASTVLADSKATTVSQALIALQREPGLQNFAQALGSAIAQSPTQMLN